VPPHANVISFLHENPIITIVGERAAQALSRLEPSLELHRAYYDDEDIPPIGSTFEGISWKDL
jgi:hypothetical protein